MNRMSFKKASSLCLAVAVVYLQIQPLTALPVYADEDIILDEEISGSDGNVEVWEAEESEEEILQEDVTAEEFPEEENIEEDSTAEDEMEAILEDAEEIEFDSAATNIKVLSGSMSSKLSQLKQQFPAGRYWNHQVTATHEGDKQYTKYNDSCNNPEGTTNHPCGSHDVYSSSSSLKNPSVGGYSCNYFDNGIQCNGYARLIFYKLHGKRVSSLTIKKPSSVNEIKVGDFVHISSSRTTNHSLVVTSVNTSKRTITGTDANNGASCKIDWNSSFNFNEVDYVVSPDNPVAGIAPSEDADSSTFMHNPNNTKTYILHFDTSAQGTTAILNNVTCFYKDNTFIPENVVSRPGYLLKGWKIKLPSGQNLKYSGYSMEYGLGEAENGGVSILKMPGENDDIIFFPGNAFWADEGPQGATFTLLPQWEKDPDYTAPTQPSNPTTPVQPVDPANPFDDVKKGDWYYDWVVKSNAAGLMTGLNSTHFGPNDKMSRAMVATVLYRMAGSPNISDTQIFPDVPAGQWYSKAIKWANEKKVATGYENGKFGPDDNITREQLATMICRYQRNVVGKSTSDKASLDKFPDKKNVNDFARESVQYCVAKGIITGSHGHLLPVDNATRAECAKMLLVAKDAK